jgi:glycosyltransferase involved in cell wall biosynthesis
MIAFDESAIRSSEMGPIAPTLSDYEWLREKRRGYGVRSSDVPLISVVTVTLNAARTLERTIASVHAQTYPSVEHIVVDGGSTDGTVEILKERVRPQDFWFSEKDRGISDAFNKGIALSRGEYVQILNADDWLSSDQLSCAVESLSKSASDFVFGDCVCYESGAPVFRSVGDANYTSSISRKMPTMNHLSMLVRRSAYERYGLFSLEYRNAMDYEWLARVHSRGAKGIHDPRIVAHMSLEGVSLQYFTRTYREVRDVAVMYGRHPLVAELEHQFRVAKTTLSIPLKRFCKPVYDVMRSTINSSYQPIR